MSTQPIEKFRCTVSEYLHYERESIAKHEYRDGEVLAMAGGSYNHSVIVANVIGELRAALKGKPCRVSDSNLRIRIPRTPLYTYPDAVIVCGEPRFDPNDTAHETVTNPRVLVEVLSPSTEAYDRGEKFTRYQLLDTLEEYVLITQDSPRTETYFRQSDGAWLFTPGHGIEARLRLRSLELDLPHSEIYAGITFPPPTIEAAP